MDKLTPAWPNSLCHSLAYQTKCHFKLKGVELYFAFGCSRLPSNSDFSMALEDLKSGLQ